MASMGWIINWPDEVYEAHHRKPHFWNVHTVEAARAEAQRLVDQYGADILKVHTGVTADQVRAIAEVAREHGLKITGHTGDREDTISRFRAGQNAIEHLYVGTPVWHPEIYPDIVSTMLECGTYVVPTMIQTEIQETAMKFPQWKDNPRARATTPADLWADIRSSIEHPLRFPYYDEGIRWRRIKNMKGKINQLFDAGVKLLVGTDGGTPMNFQTDATWQEMDIFARYGIPPMEVIVMATRRNAEYLGQLKNFGTITRGKLADIIVVDGNPLLSMRDLRNVVVVVKDGRIYKGGD
jgi:imidazolonepropionase-like amidohydrolase